MDPTTPCFDSYALTLRLAISSIDDLEAFSFHIIPDDNIAANFLIFCLQDVKVKLEMWASEYPLPAYIQTESLWRMDAIQPLSLPEATSDKAGSTSSTVATASSPATGTTIVCNSHLGIINNLETLHERPESPICNTFPLLYTVVPESFERLYNGDVPNQPPSILGRDPNSQYSSQPVVSNSEFAIEYEHSDLRGSTLSYFEKITSLDGFQSLVRINNMPKVSWNSIATSGQDMTKRHQQGVRYRRNYDHNVGPYISLLLADDQYEFQSPLDDVVDMKPSGEICSRFLEMLLVEAPQENANLSYLVGPPFDDRWNNLMDPGDSLRTQLPGDIEGITSPYWYLGERFSGSAFRKEDCNLRSMNLVLYGFKLWLIIDVQDGQKFEQWVRQLWGQESGYDDQWLRHLNLILPPLMLQGAGIKFRLVCAGPGELVLISPNQYYYAVNMTTNLATSVNFLFPQEYMADKQTPLCEDCGLYPWANHVPCLYTISTGTRKKGKRGKSAAGRPKSSRPRKIRCNHGFERDNHVEESTDTEDDQNIQRSAVIKKLRAQPANCLMPTYTASNPPTAHILRLAMAMRGYSAIAQVWRLRELIQTNQCTNISMPLIDRSLNGDSQQAALDKGILLCNGANQQFNLLRRLLTWHFAEAAELSKSPIAIRVSTATVNRYVGDSLRSRYSKIKYRGDLLHMVCGSHRGLLPFIPLQRDNDCGISDPEAQYQYSATKKDFNDFKKVFEIQDACTRVFCAIGTSFLDSWGYKDACHFGFDDWLCRLYQNFSDKSVEEMAEDLGEGICGCTKRV